MTREFVLVSHLLCPYVQRASIVLDEKGVPFERRYVDLADKPDWFRRVSPLGKTPVLLVGDEPIFESAVICDYLDETVAPRLHPLDPLERARHRGWIEFGSALLGSIAGFYNAKDESALAERRNDIRARLTQLELATRADPYFAGTRFSIVDAAFGPVFRYFDVFASIDDFGFMDGLPALLRWRATLFERPSVRAAVRPDYADLLRQFFVARRSALSRRMTASTDVGRLATKRPI
jgi:glutathione S-transferase